VPCHNDPWPGNLLDAEGRIYLIDWEYSGMNDPMWDLANLSVEAGFGPAQDRNVMEAYFGANVTPSLYSRLEVYKAMGDLHWSLWGFVQHAKGNTTEDFWDYGLNRLRRSNARMSSADFGRHLDLVHGGSRSRASKRAFRVDQERRNSFRSVQEG
jgi:thiamine kinase-like enzyme